MRPSQKFTKSVCLTADQWEAIEALNNRNHKGISYNLGIIITQWVRFIANKSTKKQAIDSQAKEYLEKIRSAAEAAKNDRNKVVESRTGYNKAGNSN